MTIDAPKIPTFALHMNGWKRAVFRSFFPERRFVYLPLNVTAEAFERKWMARIAATKGAEVFIWGHNLPANLETVGTDPDELAMRIHAVLESRMGG